ncbi:MAG: NAD(P)-binding domain-containing protein [Rhodospirillales bacterium]|jgi:pyrroline-5-carboxylate reductase|nr:NAD(P)-binding domain-containing protein [Rhodospirillales bacterium]
MKQKVGILGVGHLASYMVKGMMRHDDRPEIILSPRGAIVAQHLSETYDLEIAKSNETLVEQCDVVLLATRPPDLLEAISGLPWRADQTAISVAAGVALPGIERAVSPATAIRSLPVTAAEIGESPTCLYPENSTARTLLEMMGPVYALDNEKTFELASIQGVVFSVFHAGIASVADWFEQNGLEPTMARNLAASALRATGGMVLEHPENSFDHMINEYASPGTLTKLALETLQKNGGLSGWHDALDKAQNRSLEINKSTQ